jgi:glycosyltransferase involved in cell wall biosynthesis
MKSSSLVVVPSRMESLPTTVKEAFFLNIPVVATNIGGIPELITHDKTGILVTPNNSDNLADAINNLLLDKRKSEKLAVNASIFLKNNMTWDVVLPKFIKFYEELFNE